MDNYKADNHQGEYHEMFQGAFPDLPPDLLFSDLLLPDKKEMTALIPIPKPIITALIRF